MSDVIDISGLSVEHLKADKPMFGTAEYAYDPGQADTPEKTLASKVNWTILIFVILMVLVLANAMDISKYTAKITGRETVNQTNVNKWMMLIFLILGFIGVIWEYIYHGKFILMNNSSSEHGVDYDSMFSITLILTSIVFFMTQFLLFMFSFMYAHKEGKKALYYAHNNRLELLWTFIPAVVLTILVLRGHQTWKSVVYAEENHKGKINSVEVFAYQFGWKARYAGEDGIMGMSDYKFISGTNELGLAVKSEVDMLLEELKLQIIADEETVKNLNTTILDGLMADFAAADGVKNYKSMESIQKKIDAVKNGDRLSDLKESIERKKKQIERILAIQNDEKIFASTFTPAAIDDIIAQEIHIAKDSLVTFNFRSKDIIHSAWLPHFRAQMNVVPGMPTKFTFRPTKSTAEAKAENDEEFDYYLYCNKICGVSHYNMKIKVVVESQAEVDAWLKTQSSPFMKKTEVVPAIMNDSLQMTNDTLKRVALR
ncbi:MAG: cytochrome c oxidase subunit II [Bacteroidia bacterium]|nr:cytochrome c oxidase subunit II [Bacteroidia bacterium]